MNIKAILVCLLLACFMPVSLYAQTAEPQEVQTEDTNPIEKIVEESEGNVEIIMTDDLLELILAAPKVGQQRSSSGQNSRNNAGKRVGYRIQVFSDGHNPSSLQARAKARGSAISARLPKYRGQVYTYSKSPYWFTTVGNFATIGEANAALAELKRAFPAFSSEMRVVKSSIVKLK